MSSSSSDDGVPIGERRAFKSANEIASIEAETQEFARDVSPLPDWLSQKATPTKADLVRADSDSDEELPARKSKSAAATAARTKKRTAEPADGEGLEATTGLPAELPLVMPEKLAKNKCLLELQTNEHGAGDLTGDIGVIGRFEEKGGDDAQLEMLLDWKGSLFKARMLRSAQTMLVAHVQDKEVKVEDVFNSYVSLEEIEEEAAADRGHYMMYDSGDEYMSDTAAKGNGGKGKETAKPKAAPKATIKVKRRVATKKGAKKK